MFNVPHAIRLNDSLGNEFLLRNNESPEIVWIKNVNGEITKFNVCEHYSLWVTMDPSFEKDDYRVSWSINGKVISTDTMVCFETTEEMVGEKIALTFQVVQNKKWHKFTIEDQRVLIWFCVMPPMD